MSETVIDMPPTPERELRILYQFCGAGDMRGGVQDAVNSMGGYMQSQGHHAEVFIGTADSQERTREIFHNFESHNLLVLGGDNHYTTGNKSQNPLGGLILPSLVREAFDVVNPDIVHIQSPWMPHMGGLVLGAARRADVPTIGTWHIHSTELKTNALLTAGRIANKRVINDLDAMIVVSDAAEQHMRKKYKYKGDVHKITNGIDVDYFADAQPFEIDELFKGYDPSENYIISFVGRPDERKGLSELIKATAALKQWVPNIQLVIGSSGPDLEERKQLARELGVDNITHFLGDIDNDTKARLYASSDIAALPAMYGESQGIVLLEAMAAGAKVVMGGDNPGYRGVLGEVDCDDMVLVDPTNAGDFAKRMQTILEGTDLSAHIHEQQQFLVQKYDISVVGQQVLDLYKQIAA